MAEYFIRRTLWVIPVVIAVAAVRFFLMYRTSGGPWSREKDLPPSTVRSLNRQFGLDKPQWLNPEALEAAVDGGTRNPLTLGRAYLDSQFFNYMFGVFRFDLGPTFASKGADTVQSVIIDKFPISLKIRLVGIVFAVVVGLPLGIVSALRQNTWLDYLSLFTSTVGISVPTFVSGLLLLLILTRQLGFSPIRDPEKWAGLGRAYLLPGVVLGLGTMAYMARLTRASMLEVKRQDYVRTARAKGVSARGVIGRHMLERVDSDHHGARPGGGRLGDGVDHHRVDLRCARTRPRVRRIDLQTGLLGDHGDRDLLRRADRDRQRLRRPQLRRDRPAHPGPAVGPRSP